MFEKLEKMKKYTPEQIDFKLGQLAAKITHANFQLTMLEIESEPAEDNKKIAKEIDKLKKSLKIYKEEEKQLQEAKNELLMVNTGKAFNLDT